MSRTKELSRKEEQQDVALEFVRASDIKPKEVKWLWYPYIPFGKVTLLQGDPGDGKSKLMLALSALLSRGQTLPFDDEENRHEPMTVIYQTTEDDADDTVVPRFLAAGGQADNLIFIKEESKRLTFGDDRIRKAIIECGAKLLILDPLSSYIGADCSMNASNETRAAFNHLIAVAKETGCAIVIIAHMNKCRDTSPLYRTLGSIDIAGAARSILGVFRMKKTENPDGRIMVQVKSNLAPSGSAIVFEVQENGVNFIDEVEMTADEAIAQSAPEPGRPSAIRDSCTAYICDMLKNGKLSSVECMERLKAAGFKRSTIKKSKKDAGVVSVKTDCWHWVLQTVDNTSSEKPAYANYEEIVDDITSDVSDDFYGVAF